MKRRSLVSGLVPALLAAPGILRSARAQTRTLQMGIWGGAQGEYIRKSVVPAFEAEHGCKVLLEEGVTLSQIARLRATKDNPKYSVMFIDPLGIELAKREGLIAPLPKAAMPNIANVYPRYVLEDGYGVAFGVTAAAMFYNPTKVKPPGSYADLWDPSLKKRVTIIGVRNTPSAFLVIAAAAVATGKPLAEAQYLTDAAWPKLMELKPNVANLFESNIAATYVSGGEADIGAIDYSQYIYPYTAKGAPVDMAFPEGGRLRRAQLPGDGQERGPNPELTAAFMNRMLDRTRAEGTERGRAWPPRPWTASPSRRRWRRCCPTRWPRSPKCGLFNPDAANINANRSAWIEKLNQIFVS